MNILNKIKKVISVLNNNSQIENSNSEIGGLGDLVKNKLEKHLQKIKNREKELSKKGYSKSEIDKILEDEFGPGDKPIYKWQLGECILSESTKEFFKDEGIKLIDSKYCPDCAGREGQINTFEGWEAAGLPQSGFSVCREGCTCTLIKIDK